MPLVAKRRCRGSGAWDGRGPWGCCELSLTLVLPGRAGVEVSALAQTMPSQRSSPAPDFQLLLPVPLPPHAIATLLSLTANPSNVVLGSHAPWMDDRRVMTGRPRSRTRPVDTSRSFWKTPATYAASRFFTSISFVVPSPASASAGAAAGAGRCWPFNHTPAAASRTPKAEALPARHAHGDVRGVRAPRSTAADGSDGRALTVSAEDDGVLLGLLVCDDRQLGVLPGKRQQVGADEVSA